MSVEALTERIRATAASIAEPDVVAARAARAVLDAKTKPRGSLGRAEQLARRIAAIRGAAGLRPLPAAIVVAAADHGVAAEDVSAYPPEVTRQMLANFANGGAAINVLARRAGAELIVVDAGVLEPVNNPQIRALRIGAGTANFREQDAMTREQALGALNAGIQLAQELAARGIGIVGLGEMGIGNSTAAAAISAVLLDQDPRAVCGRGTGIDDAGLSRKVSVVRAGLRRRRVERSDPIGVLAGVGGFEIGLLAGVALGAAAARMVVVLDGFISTSAALIAAQIEPRVTRAMLAAHRSPEPGHRVALGALRLEPLLEWGLRLGEGSGVALALPLIQASLAIVDEMATFADSGVTDTGR
jgi:nicotinate-nucleotide--dimethylbenzimidazole phosphoribosyltransferase